MLKALLYLTTAGFSWVVIGAVVGLIERRNYTLLFYQIVGSLGGILAGFLFGAFSGSGLVPHVTVPMRTWLIVSVSCFTSGIFNYTMFWAMGRAMKRGPNAVVWAIIQSGLIYPFVMGWLVFGETMNICRGAGILLIVASVFLYSASVKSAGGVDSPSQPLKAWLGPALIGMLFCGINQCCSVLPSFVENGKDFPGAYRMMVLYSGMLAGCVVEFIMRYPARGVRAHLQPGELKTILICALAVMLIGNMVSVVFTYPGMDAIESLGRGSMAYPVMVCSCIIGFFPYGILVLREKFNLVQAIGVVIGTTGIILGCLFK